MEDRTFVYKSPFVAGIPPDFPNKENVHVLKDAFQHRPGPFRRLLQCDEWLYTLLLEYNVDEKDCVENFLLSKLYHGLEKDEHQLMYPALDDCAKPFWSFILKDYRQRYVPSEDHKPFLLHPFSDRALTSIKLQVKTVNGSLQVYEHESELANGPNSFPNVFPNVATFSEQDVDILDKVSSNAFRVRLRQVEYCLKMAWWRRHERLEKEIEALHQLIGHPNILQLKGLLVDDEKRVLGMLTPFIHGNTLRMVKECGEEQKSKWKAQLLDAINFAHKLGVV
ncbi:Protein kinase [Gracilaria domingensis]|nr:Protein kinase [Gracilaria domingensis]